MCRFKGGLAKKREGGVFEIGGGGGGGGRGGKIRNTEFDQNSLNSLRFDI